MRDHDRDIDQAIALLREPVAMDHTLDARVMAEIARVPAPRRLGPVGRAGLWLVRPRPVRVPPAVVFAAAAALVLAVVRPWGGAAHRPAPDAVSTAFTAAAGNVRPTRFMLVAPAASAVTLVGDFNDWTADSTPMTTDASGGLWSVTIPLEPGRYRYAFLVDGDIWTPDPGAPRAVDDDFGRPNSVLTIGGL
jgi:Carbohydrate-binding module 48 (Isoamylase N-terminal domain)